MELRIYFIKEETAYSELMRVHRQEDYRKNQAIESSRKGGGSRYFEEWKEGNLVNPLRF
jgi:hypothetical protein